MTQFSLRSLWLVSGLISVTLFACNDEDPPQVNSGELITGVYLNFSDSAGLVPDTVAAFTDADGPGGNGPTRFDTIRLEANTTYYCTLELFDESKNPVVNIGDEVEEEGVDHQFYFTVETVDIEVVYNDVDANGNPLGIESIWRGGATGAGSVTVTLKHKPGQKGLSDPINIGDTDVEIAFPVILH